MKKQIAIAFLASLTWVGSQMTFEMSTSYENNKNLASEIKPLDMNDPTPDPIKTK